MNTKHLILHEAGNYFVKKAAKGYEVYENGVTAATRRAIFGSEGPEWLRRAILDCDRRATEATRSASFDAGDNNELG